MVFAKSETAVFKAPPPLSQLERILPVTCFDSITLPKRCTKCGNEYPRTKEYFNADKRASDGLISQCKRCVHAYSKGYRDRSSEKRQRNKNRWQEEHREQVRSHVNKYRQSRQQMRRAQAAVSYAVRSGRLVRVDTLKCAQCDATAQAYHHESYEPERWLDVIPLCDKCHRRLHSAIRSTDLAAHE